LIRESGGLLPTILLLLGLNDINFILIFQKHFFDTSSTFIFNNKFMISKQKQQIKKGEMKYGTKQEIYQL